MLQEIITFIIIVFAITLTAWKIIRRFSSRKGKPEPGCDPEDSNIPDKCYDCHEECIMKNELISKMKNKPDSGTIKEQDKK